LRRLLIILALLGVTLAAVLTYSVLTPYQGYSAPVFVDIRRGAGSVEIAGQLASAGVLRTQWPFLVLRLVSLRAVLQAGEYHFHQPLSPYQVFRKIAAGDVFYYSITVPEGYSMFEIAEAVARTEVISREQFLAEARRGERLVDLAPGAKTLEGFLFPDTYRVTRQTTAAELVGQMIQRFREVHDELKAARPAWTRNVYETVVLASLVEKETPLAAERPIVASVFENRLRIGMPLQCDPTVIYALQLADRYRGEIHKEDLSFQSPYNTYLHFGLPPGPIANPGRASLQATLDPNKTDYLYFVADNKGGHVFSSDLSQHSQAVANYRRGIVHTPERTKNAGRR